ncbi:MAG: outer membrane beta-barrel protein [Bdellovibrionota bacterium]
MSFVVCVASPSLWAQTDLELELELGAQSASGDVTATVDTAAPPEATSELSNELDSDFIVETPSEVASEATSTMRIDTEEEVEYDSVEQEYALNGYSIGALLFNHNYNVKANVLVNSVPVDISLKSADFRSAGIMARYAVLPYDKVGADVNISLASSMNHTSLEFSSITTLRAELNLGYAFRMGNSASVYFLAGAGYEVTKGTDINDILVPGGGAFQLGGGIGFAEKLDFEFIYSYVSHAVNDKFFESVAAAAIAGGATSVSYNSKGSAVVSNVLLGRVTYNY